MKNTVPLILSLLFFLPSDLQAQVKKYVLGDSIFVWASSLNMREGPGPNTKIIGKVPYGAAVVVVDDSIGLVAYKFKAVAEDTLDSGEKTKPFYLHGFWVKVNFDGTAGYVFDGYLSKVKTFPVYQKNHFNDIDKWAKNTFRLEKKITKLTDCELYEYQSPSSAVRISTGCEGSGCGYSIVKIKDISFEEGVMLGLQIFNPAFSLVKEKNKIIFDNGELCRTSIFFEDGFWVISQWCCC